MKLESHDQSDQKDHIKSILRTLREAKAAIENNQNTGSSYKPEDLWMMCKINDGDGEKPIPPQLYGILTGHVTSDELDDLIKQYERDLQDISRSNEELLEEPSDDIERDIDPVMDNSENDESIEEDNLEEQKESEKPNEKQSKLSSYVE